MDSNDEIKEINIKNHACYYVDEIIKIKDFNVDNIVTDEKSYENFLVYDILHKSLINSRTLRIRFDKVDGFNRVYDGTRYSVLFEK